MKSIKMDVEPMWVYNRVTDLFVYGPCKKIGDHDVLIFREKAYDPEEDEDVVTLEQQYYDVISFNDKFPMNLCVDGDLTVLIESIKTLHDRYDSSAKALVDEAANNANKALAFLEDMEYTCDIDVAFEKALSGCSSHYLVSYLKEHYKYDLSTDKCVIDYGNAIVMWRKGYIELPVRDEDDNAPCAKVPLSKIANVEYFSKNKQSYISFKTTDGTLYTYKESKDIKGKYKSYLELLSLGLVK